MGRAAGAGDDDAQAAFDGAGDIFLQPVRVAMGGNDLGFAGDAKSASASAAAFIVGQSESLPIKMPTRGLVSLAFIADKLPPSKLKVII